MTTMMRKIVGLVAALMVLYAGWRVWLSWHDANVRADSALVARDSALASRDRERALAGVERRDRAEERARDRLTNERANDATRLRNRELATMTSRMDSVIRSQLLPDRDSIMIVSLDSLVAGFTERIAGGDSTATRLRLDIRGLLADKAECEKVVAELNGAVADWRRQAEMWKRRAHPSFFKKLLGWVPAFVAGSATAATVVVVTGGGRT